MISYGQPAIIGRELCGDLRNLSSFRNIIFNVKFIGQPHVFSVVVANSGNRCKNLDKRNISCFGQHALVMAWKFVIYWPKNGSDIWFCGMSIHSWSNMWVCRHFSSCRSYLIHIYIDTTKIHHCRNFALYAVLLGDRRFSSSCGTRSACFVRA